MHLPPARAAPGDLSSRSESAAISPTEHMPPAPCTLPVYLRGTLVTLPLLPLLRLPPQTCSRPPAACLHRHHHRPSPPPPSPQDAPSTVPRSLPVRPCIRESSPENRSVPETRSRHQASTFRDRRSCTSSLQPLRCTHPARTSPPSTPADRHIRVLLPSLRCRSLRLP